MDKIEADVRSVFAAFAQKETEETWNGMDESLGKLKTTLKAVALQDGYKSENILAVAKKLQSHIVGALLSERSRLSRTALELVESLSSVLGRDFDLISDGFVSSIITLTGRSNKVFVSSATSCLKSVIQNSQVSRVIPNFVEALKSKSKSMRASAADAILECLDSTLPMDLADHHQLIETAIKTAIEDSNPLVREGARSMYNRYYKVFPERTGALHQSLPTTAKKYLNIIPPREPQPRPNLRQIRSALQAAKMEEESRNQTDPSTDTTPMVPPATPSASASMTKQSPATTSGADNVDSHAAPRRPRISSVFVPATEASDGSAPTVPKTPLHATLGSALRRPRPSIGGNMNDVNVQFSAPDRTMFSSARRVRPDTTSSAESKGAMPVVDEDVKTDVAGLASESMPVFVAPKRRIGASGAQRVAVPTKVDEPVPTHRIASETRRRMMTSAPLFETPTTNQPESKEDSHARASVARRELATDKRSIGTYSASTKPEETMRDKKPLLPDKPTRKPPLSAIMVQPTVQQASSIAQRDRSRIPTMRSTEHGSMTMSPDYSYLSAQIKSADWSTRQSAFLQLSKVINALPLPELERHSARITDLLGLGCGDTHFKVLTEALDAAALLLSRIEKPRDHLDAFIGRALIVAKSGQFKAKAAAMKAADGVLQSIEDRCAPEDVVTAALGALGVPEVVKNGKVRAGVVEMATKAVARAHSWASSHTRFLMIRLGPLSTDLEPTIKEATRAAMLTLCRINVDSFFANLYALSSAQRRSLRQLLIRDVPDWDRLERDAGTGDRMSNID
ncbi:hypothetical protein M427DRAFT_403077 [Gonapodya prolifera JEL478]|uniref:TOG domain-containing protein n=1 Tax=Gonapodya prolifera (strain JEL478) TaxID=1344416 RepID=A0A139ATS8_GONPJ|nr:hypothetical protein M427DRAFT_403077 [Gonapodya prolifera JEL478]|eukprot:KXS20140.1 hypothetical protein M427DRAFT_403077 [Gonapodya prolifera JEL478]